MNIARHRLQQNFSRAAAQYDARAQFQHIQTRRVFDAAQMLLPVEARLLDIGCGTGYFARLAAEKRPAWNVPGLDIAAGMCAQAATHGSAIQADAAALPIASGVLDAAVSSLCLQWVENKSAAFAEIARVLRPGGCAVIATLGDRTLHELRAAATQADVPLGLLPMSHVEEYHAAIATAGLSVTLCEQRAEVAFYPSVSALLDSMRNIGAGNNFAEPSRGFIGSKRWRAMLAAYETLRTPRGIPATWEHLFMLLRKPS